jgi:ParB family chromosome partitioning protein
MEIISVPISDIVPYENNPRKNDGAVDIVAKSIKEFGFLVPVILDNLNVIVAGHTRVKAGIKLGLTEVPVIYAENLSNEQIKAFRIMDNKTSEYADWDTELLKTELEKLKELNFDLDLTGFNEIEASKIISDIHIRENVFIDTKNPKYQVIKGDIYGLSPYIEVDGKKLDVEVIE